MRSRIVFFSIFHTNGFLSLKQLYSEDKMSEFLKNLVKFNKKQIAVLVLLVLVGVVSAVGYLGFRYVSVPAAAGKLTAEDFSAR